jgi:Uma2 family endonuclease
MTTAHSLPRLTFEEFLDYDDGTGRLFELIDETPVPMPEPSEEHERIVRYLDICLTTEINRLGLPWFPSRRLVKIPVGGFANGRRPDLAIVTEAETPEESKARALYAPPHLVIEIASRNWTDDLKWKTQDYALLKVPEYWVVDYRGQIPEKDCLRGKGIKTIVFSLQGFRYERREFVGDEEIPCTAFPELKLTTNSIVNRGR